MDETDVRDAVDDIEAEMDEVQEEYQSVIDSLVARRDAIRLQCGHSGMIDGRNSRVCPACGLCQWKTFTTFALTGRTPEGLALEQL